MAQVDFPTFEGLVDIPPIPALHVGGDSANMVSDHPMLIIGDPEDTGTRGTITGTGSISNIYANTANTGTGALTVNGLTTGPGILLADVISTADNDAAIFEMMPDSTGSIASFNEVFTLEYGSDYTWRVHSPQTLAMIKTVFGASVNSPSSFALISSGGFVNAVSTVGANIILAAADDYNTLYWDNEGGSILAFFSTGYAAYDYAISALPGVNYKADGSLLAMSLDVSSGVVAAVDFDGRGIVMGASMTPPAITGDATKFHIRDTSRGSLIALNAEPIGHTGQGTGLHFVNPTGSMLAFNFIDGSLQIGKAALPLSGSIGTADIVEGAFRMHGSGNIGVGSIQNSNNLAVGTSANAVNGSLAIGDSTDGVVSALGRSTRRNVWQLGPGVNSADDALQVGTTIRVHGVEDPVTADKHDGSIYVRSSDGALMFRIGGTDKVVQVV